MRAQRLSCATPRSGTGNVEPLRLLGCNDTIRLGCDILPSPRLHWPWCYNPRRLRKRRRSSHSATVALSYAPTAMDRGAPSSPHRRRLALTKRFMWFDRPTLISIVVPGDRAARPTGSALAQQQNSPPVRAQRAPSAICGDAAAVVRRVGSGHLLAFGESARSELRLPFFVALVAPVRYVHSPALVKFIDFAAYKLTDLVHLHDALLAARSYWNFDNPSAI